MLKSKTLLVALVSIFTYNNILHSAATKPQWDFLTYIQADNSLASFAGINIKDMQKVGSTTDVNILVQWDKPNDRSTYRYKILQNNLVLNSSIPQEMGYAPASELVSSMKWVKNSFPAQRYALILWNHGNGVLDRSKKNSLTSWIELPGFSNKDRGILYDATQNTFLDNVGLSTACAQIKASIGQNIDILGADACLMSMIEIAYQVKDSVNYFVASQQTEPGLGWPYADVLSALVGMPTMSTADFSTAITQAYGNFYASGENEDASCTMAAIDVSKIQAATTAFNFLLKSITEAQTINKLKTNSAIKTARTNTLSFYISDYVDLIDLYDNLNTSFAKFATARNKQAKKARRDRYTQSADTIILAIANAKATAQACIVATQNGSDYNGRAHGLSIYFPANYQVDSSYRKTTFAKQTSWVTVLNSLR